MAIRDHHSLCCSAAVAVSSPPLRCPVQRFRPYGGSLLANAPKVSKRSCPLRPARLRRVPSFHHCFRGTPRRAIPGPSRFSRHPCRSTPSAMIPLGLLMGRLASSVRSVFLEAQQTVGAGLPAMLLVRLLRSAFQKSPRRRGP